jgi:hypothetical protein
MQRYPEAIAEKTGPISGRIPDAQKRYGLSRSGLYRLAAQYQGFFKKCGGATLVDYLIGDAIIEKLPPAKINRAEVKTQGAAAPTT